MLFVLSVVQKSVLKVLEVRQFTWPLETVMSLVMDGKMSLQKFSWRTHLLIDVVTWFIINLWIFIMIF